MQHALSANAFCNRPHLVRRAWKRGDRGEGIDFDMVGEHALDEREHKRICNKLRMDERGLHRKFELISRIERLGREGNKRKLIIKIIIIIK